MMRRARNQRQVIVSGLLGLVLGTTVVAQGFDEIKRQAPVREVGPERQLFLDDWLIDRIENVARWVHVARKAPENPIFKAERPWEGNRILYSNVIYDRKERLYKLWYNVRPESTNYLCFATSGDGIRFRRPDLGLRDFQGSRQNNLLVIPEDITEIRVFYDDHDPERPYKMAFMKYDTYGIGVGWSSDGLHWESHPYPVIVPAGDGLSTPFWDQRRERYVYYHRPNGGHVLRWSKIRTPEAYPTRRIGLAESFNFTLWTDLKEVVAPDERDGAGTEFYYMPVFPYESGYVGMLIVYHEYTGDPEFLDGFNFTLDAQLAFSRNGKNWTRVGDRHIFLKGTPGTWDDKRVYPECAVVQEDEIRIYYRGSSVPHRTLNELVGTEYKGRTLEGDALGLARLRPDGFVSVRAGEEEGLLTTWPLRFQGGELRVNVDAAGGSLRVEALTQFGKPIAGFEREACRPIEGNGVGQKVQWNSGRSLGELDQPVRLRFILKYADLYSFQIR